MKILHYVGAFSLPSETFIYDLITNLEDNGLDNYVLTHSRQLEDERPFNKVKVISEDVSFMKKVYHKLFKSWNIRNFKDVLKYIDEVKPDIIHAHFGPNGVKIFKLIEEFDLNIPLVISMHGTDTTQYPLKYNSYKKLLKKIGNLNGVIFTFPSKFLRNEFEKNVSIDLNVNHCVLPNSFNQQFLNLENSQIKKDDDIFRIITIGRLINIKGFEYLIDAVSMLDSEFKDWELHILGDGTLKSELVDKAGSLNIKNKIYFHGFVMHSEVSQLLKKSNLYIQPSIVDTSTNQTESFGVAVVEAIASGLPVIVTDVGGLPDTVMGGDKDFAKIIRSKAPDELLKEIKIMIDIEKKNDVYREKIIKEYSKTKQIERLLDIYKKMRVL